MALEDELHQAMIDAYRRAGREVGYWGRYFLRSIKRHHGLATAQRMLRPTKSRLPQKGLQALIDAGRPDLSLEALVVSPRFASLFTPKELEEARRRLGALPEYTRRRQVQPEDVYPEALPDDREYYEAAVRRIAINAYERDPRARAECLRRHGIRCKVCGLNFERRYGRIGKGFIHVHHVKPLAASRGAYRLNPTKDLVPVCPNCHAMLHTSDPPLSVEELKEVLARMANKGMRLMRGKNARG
jgi:5-methylcytosine-specific restriction protein A